MAKKEIKLKPVGRLVMVHPESATGPAFMRGQMGKIIEQISDDLVKVGFKQEMNADYFVDELLTMHSLSAIITRYQDNRGKLRPSDEDIIRDVIRLLATNRPDKALKRAMESPMAEQYCVLTIQQWLDEKKMVQEIKSGKGRNLSK